MRASRGSVVWKRTVGDATHRVSTTNTVRLLNYTARLLSDIAYLLNDIARLLNDIARLLSDIANSGSEIIGSCNGIGYFTTIIEISTIIVKQTDYDLEG
ncbi:MAG: hypothetical protein JW894_15770 [Bacteroidales bacterium]|nr:hypothetical protein [Bacteroidales bacterium]